jgi:uncharacterized protein (TIGR00251 family)
MLRISDGSDGCTLPVRVHPGAKRNAINGIHDGALKISLTTPPTDGRANEALIGFVADILRLPKARVSLVSGQTNRSKVLRITGLNAEEVRTLVSPDLVV